MCPICSMSAINRFDSISFTESKPCLESDQSPYLFFWVITVLIALTFKKDKYKKYTDIMVSLHTGSSH